MFRHAFAHPLLLLTLASLPALGVLALWARRRRARALARFGGAFLGAVPPARGWLRGVRGLCLLLGLVCLGLGGAGPQWGRDYGQAVAPGRDLVVVLDCSRSMFAEAPSRLEQARNALFDLTAALARRGGYRVGLVVFAGKARLVCPLTHDLDHFRHAVEAIDLDDPDPELEPGKEDASGTRIGRALALAVEAQDGRTPAARDLLLLSDGDDPARDGEWRAGAARAKAEGIPVHCVGLGDPKDAHPVPLARGAGWLLQNGQPVSSRLQAGPLREIARATGGTLALPGNRSLPLGAFYLDAVAASPLREESPDALPVSRQRYAWFLGPAFLLLALTLLISDRPSFSFAFFRRRGPGAGPSTPGGRES